MERLLSDWAERHPDVEVTVLRSGWIFGPEVWNRVVAYFALPVVTTFTLRMMSDPLPGLPTRQRCR